MVEKFGDKDAKNGNFNNQMGFRKKSNVLYQSRMTSVRKAPKEKIFPGIA